MRKYEVTPFEFSFMCVVEANSKEKALEKFAEDMKGSFKWKRSAWDKFVMDLPMATIKVIKE